MVNKINNPLNIKDKLKKVVNNIQKGHTSNKKIAKNTVTKKTIPSKNIKKVISRKIEKKTIVKAKPISKQRSSKNVKNVKSKVKPIKAKPMTKKSLVTKKSAVTAKVVKKSKQTQLPVKNPVTNTKSIQPSGKEKKVTEYSRAVHLLNYIVETKQHIGTQELLTYKKLSKVLNNYKEEDLLKDLLDDADGTFSKLHRILNIPAFIVYQEFIFALRKCEDYSPSITDYKINTLEDLEKLVREMEYPGPGPSNMILYNYLRRTFNKLLNASKK